MPPALCAEAELERPFGRVEGEAVGMGLDAVRQAPEKEDRRGSQHRQPVLLDVGRPWIVTERIEDRIDQRSDSKLWVGKRELPIVYPITAVVHGLCHALKVIKRIQMSSENAVDRIDHLLDGTTHRDLAHR